ncbi:hypothetical protein AMTR_s00085p00076240 [Amborella trichopoda]|uniref:Uncharacterized protein n=1 Tax=Amborella trichopoda TaxID=13333 RepID=W1P426_AMBTC|nr:hypothetical protein AMTR_s00085p00076240 [Amborella trichopoda]
MLFKNRIVIYVVQKPPIYAVQKPTTYGIAYSKACLPMYGESRLLETPKRLETPAVQKPPYVWNRDICCSKAPLCLPMSPYVWRIAIYAVQFLRLKSRFMLFKAPYV